MFRGLFVFGAGVYTGIYVAQNYEMPDVKNPKNIFEDFKKWADKYKRS